MKGKRKVGCNDNGVVGRPVDGVIGRPITMVKTD